MKLKLSDVEIEKKISLHRLKFFSSKGISAKRAALLSQVSKHYRIHLKHLGILTILVTRNT
ncbi:hypothetical protein [Nostoc sp. CALU 1950]|uniref:Integrase n=1 Tax=Nostoc linckia FACHB-391 TaxID=2692906 RepID=A0ABR8ERX0_NOSLI|nr:hypothetical protein [Nostoc linckia FACHB-391]